MHFGVNSLPQVSIFATSRLSANIVRYRKARENCICMHFDNMRSIDEMRVIAKKGFRSVCTPRADIKTALKKYGFIKIAEVDEEFPINLFFYA